MPETKPGSKEAEAPKPPKVSVVVVSCNRVELLRSCLQSLERSEARDRMEILVVDNGSTDGSAQLESEEFPNTRFIRIPRNFGLTKAMNLGLRAAQGDYLFFLHEDTEVSPETAKELAACLDADTDVTAVAPMLVTAHGNPGSQVGQLPPNGNWRPVFDAGQAGMPENPQPIPVDYARGAALMVRKFFLTAMRELDERYGQFGTDADMCFQIRRAGKKILILPNLRTLHHGGADSSLKQADMKVGIAHWTGKYYGFMAGLKSRTGAALGALVRLQLGQVSYIVSGQKIDGTH
jgi:N-acetylglucosaminyl-diphospho-decaprenol L-rhamnosyltransferase